MDDCEPSRSFEYTVVDMRESIALLTGLVSGIAYSTLRPAFRRQCAHPWSGRLIELDLLGRSVSFRYEEVLSLNGVIRPCWEPRQSFARWSGLNDPRRSAFGRVKKGTVRAQIAFCLR